MTDKIIKIKGEIRPVGTPKADAKALSDLQIPDPEPDKAVAAIKRALGDDDETNQQGEAVRDSNSDN